MATVHAWGDVAPFARSTAANFNVCSHEAVPNCRCHLCSQNKRSRPRSNLMSTGTAIQTSTNYFHTSLSHRRPSLYTSQHEPHYLTALQKTKQVCLCAVFGRSCLDVRSAVYFGGSCFFVLPCPLCVMFSVSKDKFLQNVS